MPVTRRQLLVRAAIAAAAILPGRAVFAASGPTRFAWAQLRYSGSWNPNTHAAARFLELIERRTSIEPLPEIVTIDPGSETLFEYPFLCISGRAVFPRLDSASADMLRRYVERGGFIFVDDATGIPDSGFFEGASAFFGSLFPGRKINPLPADHTLYQSFYLIREIPGRKIARPFMFGMDMDDVTPVIVCQNDLLGAFEGDVSGYTHQCEPGGERQREMSFRMGINIVMYALTGNYKKEQAHIPFILKRRKGFQDVP